MALGRIRQRIDAIKPSGTPFQSFDSIKIEIGIGIRKEGARSETVGFEQFSKEMKEDQSNGQKKEESSRDWIRKEGDSCGHRIL